MANFFRHDSTRPSPAQTGSTAPATCPSTSRSPRPWPGRLACPGRLLTLWCQLGLLRQPIRRVYVATQVPDSLTLRAQCLQPCRPRRRGHLRSACRLAARCRDGSRAERAPRGTPHLDVPANRSSSSQPIGNQRRTSSQTRGRHRGHGAAGDDHAEDSLGSGPRSIEGTRHQRNGPDASPPRDSPSTRSWRASNGSEGSDGSRPCVSLAPLADGRAESPPESILRLYWIDAGLPRPVPQLEVWVDGLLIARLDLGNLEILLRSRVRRGRVARSPRAAASRPPSSPGGPGRGLRDRRRQAQARLRTSARRRAATA